MPIRSLANLDARLVEKNYAFWLTELVRSEGRDKTEVSQFGSALEFAYGVGKLLTGPLVDSSEPLIVLASTLFVASSCNLFMFQTGDRFVDLGLWTANGFVQSAAWPALASIFLNWFQDNPNRAIWYSVLSTSQNLGNALTPVFLAPLASRYGFLAAVFGPGILGIFFSFILILVGQSKPDINPSISFKTKEEKELNKKSKAADKNKSWNKILTDLLTSPSIISLSVGYAFLTMIRVGVQDWSLLILQDVRNVSLETARDCLVALEIGGFIGGLGAGVISDKLFSARRGHTMVLFMFLMIPVMCVLSWTSEIAFFNTPHALVILYLLFGFTSFGPHMLVGLTARELFPQAPATAGALTKGVAQFGGSLAGYPTSLLVQKFGWGGCLNAWIVAAGCASISFAPLLLSRPTDSKKKD